MKISKSYQRLHGEDVITTPKTKVQSLEVGLGVGLALFVPIGQQLILPCDHVLGGDLADFPLAEVGQNLLLDDVLLCQPGIQCHF